MRRTNCPMTASFDGQGLAREPRGMADYIYLLAFLSGMAALTYEVTWAKLLSLTFGRTTLAASAVVGGFLGGMGIGAWLYHLVQERVGRPLVIYATIEVAIAITAAGLTLVFENLPATFASLFRGVPEIASEADADEHVRCRVG